MFIAKEHIENNPTNVCFLKRAMNMLRYFMLFIRAIENLDDTNNAGTKKGTDCTIILTKGDSAKTLAVAGISVVGRDLYGCYPQVNNTK